jgi:hypothetical protein
LTVIPVRAEESDYLKTPFLLVLLLSASLMAGNLGVASEANPASTLDFQALELNILSPDGKQKIGSTHFRVARDRSAEVIKGETKYLDGEYDNEKERIVWGSGDSAPRLDAYEHWFFNADGSPRMVDRLDTKTAMASCASYTVDGMRVRTSRFDVARDTFAGSSSLMMVVRNLRRGIREIKFHAFACAPGPKILAVEASLPPRREQWSLYRGNLVRLDFHPDLGVLSLLVGPFIPKMDAWFNPDDNWNYVGGEFDRYFRGPHVVSVRVEQGN